MDAGSQRHPACLATGAGNDREKGGLLLVGGEMRLGQLGLGENRITNWG